MGDDSTTNKKLPRDIEGYFLEKISEHLGTISDLQYTIRQYPEKIFLLDIEMHEIFKMIIPFLQENSQLKDEKIQWLYHVKLLKFKPIIWERAPDAEGNIQKNRRMTLDFPKYKITADKRQIHIYQCMERLGIMGKLRTQTKRIR